MESAIILITTVTEVLKEFLSPDDVTMALREISERFAEKCGLDKQTESVVK